MKLLKRKYTKAKSLSWYITTEWTATMGRNTPCLIAARLISLHGQERKKNIYVSLSSQNAIWSHPKSLNGTFLILISPLRYVLQIKYEYILLGHILSFNCANWKAKSSDIVIYLFIHSLINNSITPQNVLNPDSFNDFFSIFKTSD